MLPYLAFIFVAFVAKLILALITIYLLFPADARCPRCDGETLLLQLSRGGRALSLVFLGRARRRWCPGCRWEGMARPRPVPRERTPLHGSRLPRHH